MITARPQWVPAPNARPNSSAASARRARAFHAGSASLLSIGIYVALPLVCGYLSRKWTIKAKGELWFREQFLPVLTPITIIALLATLVLLFSFKGETILSNPLTILWIAIPLFIQTQLTFALGYGPARSFSVPRRQFISSPPAGVSVDSHVLELA